jgi:hypothetical protein
LRDDEELLHAAVAVDAEDLQVGAAVASCRAAGDAWLQLRYGSTAQRSPGVWSRRRVVHFENFDAELVAEDARVGEERLLAAVGVPVGAADADAMDAD